MKCTTSSSASLIIIIITGFCVAEDPIVETHPKSQPVKSGQRVVLHCIFTLPVYCLWKRNGKQIAIKGRYAMLSRNRPTVNCSLEIRKIDPSTDTGDWTCSSPGTDERDEISSKAAKLSETKPKALSCVKKPRSVVVDIGRQVVMECKFNQKVTCSWKRNGQVVNMTDRYRLKRQSKEKNNPKRPARNIKTKDCTLVINNATYFDEGEWICGSRASDDHDAVHCKTAKVVVEDPAPNESYKNIS